MIILEGKSMSNIAGKVVVNTGASSGIGEATARLLAQSGARVVLGARRTEKLEALTSAIRSKSGSTDYRVLNVECAQYRRRSFISLLNCWKAFSFHVNVDIS
jgi:NADP-dependent 3-hydroxy acid dehydrogenase YdfG